MKRKRLYMDYAASTPLHPKVASEVLRGMRAYGNPSAPHEEGRTARACIDEARLRIARTLSVKSDNIFFTSGATEGNNIAIHGVIESFIQKGAQPHELHIVTTAFEHLSLQSPIRYWEKRGVLVSYVHPDEEGTIHPEAIQGALRPETVLVSVVAVQSEIGQIQPLKDISRVLDEFRKKQVQVNQKFAPETSLPLLHTDASQSLLFVDLSPDRLGVDIATYGSQKIQGPKGAGVLYKKSFVSLAPLFDGGKQERGVRPGTENVGAILGMAKAFELAILGREKRVQKVTLVREYMRKLLEKEIPEVTIHGGVKARIANNMYISVPDVDGDYLAVLMDKEDVAVSARSVCVASGVSSGVLEALGKDEQETVGTLRFSFSPEVTKSNAKRAVQALKKALAIARPH